jgi:hypothetical protein
LNIPHPFGTGANVNVDAPPQKLKKTPRVPFAHLAAALLVTVYLEQIIAPGPRPGSKHAPLPYNMVSLFHVPRKNLVACVLALLALACAPGPAACSRVLHSVPEGAFWPVSLASSNLVSTETHDFPFGALWGASLEPMNDPARHGQWQLPIARALRRLCASHATVAPVRPLQEATRTIEKTSYFTIFMKQTQRGHTKFSAALAARSCTLC